MHNLGNVFRFEVIRTLKKKTFWIAALAFPIIILALFSIIFFSNQTTQEATSNTINQQFSLVVTDDSGLISDDILKMINASSTGDKQAAIESVRTGSLDAYIYYPSDLNTSPVEIYAKNASLFDNSRYKATADTLLQVAAQSTTSPEIRTILQSKVSFASAIYKDGELYNGFAQLIAPGIFLILFYALITMFGSQMLSSTTEEKENRVIEMILTTIKARTLIIGKILSLFALGAIQMLVILIPTLVLYILLSSSLSMPSLNLVNIPLDPVRIGIGALLFITSFILFTGVLVGIGAASPTAKEASSFFGVVMLFIFGPLYAVTLFISSPDTIIVKFLSFFPLTAPVPLLLRNAVGNLSIPEAAIGIAILSISAVIALAMSIRLFRYGALEYSRKVSLKTLLIKKKS
jgi:ABC-2 type transport system permease protein